MADKRSIELEIKADGAQARQQLGDIAASIERVGKTAKGETKVGLDLVAQALRDLEAEGGNAGQALNQAATSVKQLDAGVVVAQRLAEQFERAAQGVEGELKPAFERAAAELRAMAQGGEQAKEKIDSITASGDALGAVMRRVGAIMAAAFSVKELISAAAQVEELKGGFESLTGSAQGAAREMDFVRAVAGSTGQDVLKTAASWRDLLGELAATPERVEPARAAFEATAIAMSAMGKGQGEVEQALGAIDTIARKGTVSLRDLRDGLLKQLPGALDVASKALGVTRHDLEELAKAGQLTADDLLPALSQGLTELYGGAPQAQSLAGEIVNIKNAFVDMAAHLGEAGGLDALKRGAELAQTAIVLLDDTLITVGKTVGTVAAAISTWDFSHLKQAFADIERESREKLLAVAKHNQTLAAYIQATGNEATKAALAQQQQAQATQQAGAAAAAASDGYVQLTNGYRLVNESMAQQVKLADEEVKAAKARGDAAIAQAKALGDVTAQRKAEGDAAAGQAKALTDLADKRATELAALQEEAKALREAATENGKISDARQQQLKTLDELIAKKTIEAQASRAQADAATAHARSVGEEVQAATAAREAAQASAISKRADAQASIMLLQAQRDIASQGEAIARMMGNEAQAREFRIQQLQIDIKITEAKAAAMKAEAEGAIAVAQATLEELRVKNALTPVKEAELAASIKIARAKMQEADAVRESVKVTEKAISNIQRFGNEAGRAGQAGANAGAKVRDGWHGAAQGIDAATASLERLNAETERQIAAREKANDLATRALKLQEAQRNAGTIKDVNAVPSFETQEQADAWLAEWKRQYTKKNPINTGASAFSTFMYETTLGEWRAEIDAMKLRNTMKGNGNASESSQTPLESMRSSTSVIRVELPNGNSYDVDTTTAAGRSQLEQMTRDLANAARRAA